MFEFLPCPPYPVPQIWCKIERRKGGRKEGRKAAGRKEGRMDGWIVLVRPACAILCGETLQLLNRYPREDSLIERGTSLNVRPGCWIYVMR